MPLLWLLLTLTGLPLAAQTKTPFQSAAATITEADLIRKVGIIAADSMQGRGTPSRGLEQTAEYVAAEFRRVGLKPLGEAGSYLQRFGVSRWSIDTARSVVEVRGNGRHDIARLGSDARFILGKIPDQPLHGPVVLITGMDSAVVKATMDVQGKIVLLVADFSRPVTPALNQKIVDLSEAGPKAVLVLSNRDSATFALRLASSARPRLMRDSENGSETGAPVIELHERSVSGVLAGAGIDLVRLRQLARSEQRVIAGLQVEVRLTRQVVARAQVPNVIGVLEGSDSLLRREYLVYSAHIDHIGISPGQPDSINNGADDNAAAVAALLELAEAFTQPGARPKRSFLFLAPSAEGDGLLGSAHFTEHPTVPLCQVVANLNMDLIGRNWRDSVIAVGMEQSDLGSVLQLVAQAHPELRMTPIADRWPEERIFYRSDHYNFARKGVPILFFTSGTHADYPQPSDEADRIDSEKEARLVRLLFYLGARVADTLPRPRWVAESYRQIVERK
ncbi:MAG: M28 family peptidase [Methyloceanibacter sp.]|uniref:M28 family peptidase n=1 Tax=Methyloceanibacter sp. TaxID=1965321 RepID=UPI003D9BE813